jgi:alkylation response protein AidB-like acyl-CoA dehydrogenase
MRTAQDALATAGDLAEGGAPAVLRDRWLASACQGRTRGGIALTGLIPGPPTLRAEPAEGGWRLGGTAPWVTGWGLIDLVQVVARGPDDTVVTLIMDAAAQPGLTVTRQHLAAVDAAVTVRLGFDAVLIPAECFVDQVPFDPAVSVQPAGLRLNGSRSPRPAPRAFGRRRYLPPISPRPRPGS